MRNSTALLLIFITALFISCTTTQQQQQTTSTPLQIPQPNSETWNYLINYYSDELYYTIKVYELEYKDPKVLNFIEQMHKALQQYNFSEETLNEFTVQVLSTSKNINHVGL